MTRSHLNLRCFARPMKDIDRKRSAVCLHMLHEFIDHLHHQSNRGLNEFEDSLNTVLAESLMSLVMLLIFSDLHKAIKVVAQKVVTCGTKKRTRRRGWPSFASVCAHLLLLSIPTPFREDEQLSDAQACYGLEDRHCGQADNMIKTKH